MDRAANMGLRAFLAFLRLCRAPLTLAILIMTSIFLGMMNSHDLPVSRSIIIAQVFTIMGILWNSPGTILAVFSGVLCIPVIVIPTEMFMIGAYSFITTVYKAGTGDCKGYADTPFGDTEGAHGLPSVRDSCGMQTANFALSIIVTIISCGCLILEFAITTFFYNADVDDFF